MYPQAYKGIISHWRMGEREFIVLCADSGEI